MTTGADVKSIDAIREFHGALVEFIDLAKRSLSEADGDVNRTRQWVSHDRSFHWDRQVRRRTERVAQAKSDLFRAQLAKDSERGSCIDEKRALQKAQAALDEAYRKVEAVNRWRRELEREALLYRGQCQQLSTMLEADLPKLAASITRMIDDLEAYIRMAPPAATATGTPADEKKSPVSKARAGTRRRTKKRKGVDDEPDERPKPTQERDEGADDPLGASQDPVA